MTAAWLALLAVTAVAIVMVGQTDAGMFVRAAQVLDQLHPSPCVDGDVDAPVPFEPTALGWGWLDEAAETFVAGDPDGCWSCEGNGVVEQSDPVVGDWISVTCQACNGTGERGAA